MRKATKDVHIGDHSDGFDVLQNAKRSRIKSMLVVNYTNLPIARGFPMLRLAVEDSSDFGLWNFDIAVAFLHWAPKPALVICDAGVSRSATFAAVFIWWDDWRNAIKEGRTGMTLVDALEMTKSEISYPSPGVFERAVEWAEGFRMLTRGELKARPEFDDFVQRAGSLDLKPRKEIGLFSKLQERKLRRHDHDFGDSWRNAPRSYLRRRLLEELKEADETDGPEEYADVANMAMFLAFRNREPAHICTKCGNEWPLDLDNGSGKCLRCGNEDIIRRGS